MKQRIENLLKNNLNYQKLEVINNSHLHKGHSESDDTGETHFKISIFSPELNSIPKIQAHRKINKLLESEFKKGLHALEIKIETKSY
jgi:BolA protein